jgi:hypothetical protein
MENISAISTDFNLAKPIYIELINTKQLNYSTTQYEFEVSYLSDKWVIKKTLPEIKNFITCLSHLKYTFIPDKESLHPNNIQGSFNNYLTDLLKYITYRYDILSNAIALEFFEIRDEGFVSLLVKENLEHILTFKIEEGDMTMSDYYYNPDLGILIVTLEDLSFYSRIGRFWSLIDYEVLGNLLIYQRVYDNQGKPYFRKLITKTFDSRVSKVEVSVKYDKIFIGMENGCLQLFNINHIENSQFKTEKIITITEGKLCKYTTEKITAMCEIDEFLIMMSKDNKIHIANMNTYEIKFVGNLKKRIEGKGHISKMHIEQGLRKLILCTVTNKFLICDVHIRDGMDISIDFLVEHELDSNIKNIFVRGAMIFIALDYDILIYNLKNDEKNNISFRDNNGISLSSKFFKLNYANNITALCFFIDMKLIILGLSTGSLVAISSRSLEVIFSKKISDCQISKIILLEENYIVIAGDEKGNIYFFKIGN